MVFSSVVEKLVQEGYQFFKKNSLIYAFDLILVC